MSLLAIVAIRKQIEEKKIREDQIQIKRNIKKKMQTYELLELLLQFKY